ncbi:MAG: hypothetical protein J6Y85_03955 [Alphaproteobacteria bacterium]|nr:hypothetical protein [Alphaproteobacteria bacterium]
MKKMSLLVFASCALLTACAEHDKCYEEAQYTRTEKVEVSECGCQKIAPCGCQQKPACGCQKKASCGCGTTAPVVQQVVPTMQPKTVVVVVPTVKQRPVLAPEVVYPEPRSCGCKR